MASMEFVLRINIDSEVTRRDIALALDRTSSTLKRTKDPVEEGDSGPVRDPEGRAVGKWEIVDE